MCLSMCLSVREHISRIKRSMRPIGREGGGRAKSDIYDCIVVIMFSVINTTDDQLFTCEKKIIIFCSVQDAVDSYTTVSAEALLADLWHSSNYRQCTAKR